MANRRVTIWRYTKSEEKWKYVKPTYCRNNKIKPEEQQTLGRRAPDSSLVLRTDGPSVDCRRPRERICRNYFLVAVIRRNTIRARAFVQIVSAKPTSKTCRYRSAYLNLDYYPFADTRDSAMSFCFRPKGASPPAEMLEKPAQNLPYGNPLHIGLVDFRSGRKE